MICPNCEYEYIEGIIVCADCGADLISVEDFEGSLLHPADWAVIKTFPEEYEAEMLKANLEGAGIDSLIYSKQDRNFPASGSWTSVKVLVKKRDIVDALEIIEDISNRSDENISGENSDEV
jgi:hypothetical protein